MLRFIGCLHCKTEQSHFILILNTSIVIVMDCYQDNFATIEVNPVAHLETSPPVLWTGKMHSWTGWTGKKMGYLIVIFGHLT